MATTLDRTWYNTLVDDSGGAIPDGSIWDKADVDSLMDTVDAMIAANIVFGGTVTATSFIGSGSITSNGQIIFPATQNPSADVNTLDDYEEQTPTPALASSGGGSATYTEQTCRSTKVGKLVFAYITITINVDSFTAGNLTLTGLPYTAAATNAGGGIAVKWSGLSTSQTGIRAVVDDGATTATLTVNNAGATSNNTMAASDVGNSTSIEFAITYQSAS